MRRFFYQSAIIFATTALGTALAWGAAHPPLSERVGALFAGTQGGNTNIFNLLIYLGMVDGVLMTLSVLGGLVAGVALARRVGASDRPPELEAAATG